MFYAMSFLGFFLLGGIVLQSVGYYLAFLLLPFLAFWKQDLSPQVRIRLRYLASGLFLMWVVFPLSNLYNAMQHPELQIPYELLLKSHFSSSFLVTAIFLYAYTWKDFLRRSKGLRIPSIDLDAPAFSSLFKPFLSGFFVFASLFTFYLIFQQVFGKDVFGQSIPESRHMAEGLYRVSGFYSHPLTLAGVGLCLLGFVGSLFLEKDLEKYRASLFILIVLSAYFIFSSGGRAATLIACAFILLVVLRFYTLPYHFSRKRSKWKSLLRMLVPFVFLSTGAFVFYKMGLWGRFFLLSQEGMSPELDRLIFWRVHWQIFLEHPWVGQGFALLMHSQREHYYDIMGYKNLIGKYSAHNMLLETLTNVGVLGFACIVWGMTRIGKAVSAQIPTHKMYVRALLFAFLLNVINGFTQNVFFDSSVSYIYLSLIMLIFWSEVVEVEKRRPHRWTMQRASEYQELIEET